MSDIALYNEKTFEDIKHIDEKGNEYWEARELQKVLEYDQWRKFEAVINKAMIACKLSKHNVSEHFAKVGKIVLGLLLKKLMTINYLLSNSSKW